jgi:hypothetical protein
MRNKLMLGLWRYVINVPPFLWKKQIEKGKRAFERSYGSLSDEHRAVHHFVVEEIPRYGKALSPEMISEKMNLPLERVTAILDDLEKKMTFLFKNRDGEVIWAYPVTVEKTPHKLTFGSGEQLYAA